MDRFLLATNPLRSESTDLYIIHMLTPRAIIKCELIEQESEKRRLLDDSEDWVFLYAKSKTENQVWKLTRVFLDISKAMNTDDLGRMMNRAWRWFRSYLDSQNR